MDHLLNEQTLGDGNDEFAEFMRWKQQKRRAARRGLDDWDQDDWGQSQSQRPVNRTGSGYSSGYNRLHYNNYTLFFCVKLFAITAPFSGPNRNAVRGQNIGYKGSNIEQGSFVIDANGIKQFDKSYVLGEENTFKGDKERLLHKIVILLVHYR